VPQRIRLALRKLEPVHIEQAPARLELVASARLELVASTRQELVASVKLVLVASEVKNEPSLVIEQLALELEEQLAFEPFVES
jgi:hypothetical protein